MRRGRLVVAHGDTEQSQASRDAFAGKAAASDGLRRRTGAAMGWVWPELPCWHGRLPDLVRPAVDLMRGRVFRGERVRERREKKEIDKRKEKVLETFSRVFENPKYSFPEF